MMMLMSMRGLAWTQVSALSRSRATANDNVEQDCEGGVMIAPDVR